MHFLPGFKHSYLSNSFFLEKGSLGLGLDAPKLEISQVVPRSPKNELCAAMTFCYAMTSYPDSENWLEMLFHQYEVMAKMGQMCCIRSSLNAPGTEIVWNSCFQPKRGFGPFLSPISSCRPEKEHSIGKMKFCIGLSLVLKLLVRKRVWNSCFQPKRVWNS